MATLPQAPSILDSISNLSSDVKNIPLEGKIKSSSSLPQAPSILDSIAETEQPTEVEVDEKVTPATLGSNEIWLDAAKKIYEDEVGESFNTEESGYDSISDWFENRHSKYNWNIVNMLDTGFSVDEKSNDVKKAWLDSMDLYDESDSDAGDFFRAAKNVLLDPTTIASLLATFGVGTVAKLGGQKVAALAAKTTFKQNLREQLKNKVSKETIEEIIKTKGSKDITAEALSTARNKAALQTVGYKSLTMIPTPAAYSSAYDVAKQEMELNTLIPEDVASKQGISIEEATKQIEDKKREGYDLASIAKSAALGGTFGALLGPLPTYIGSKIGMKKALRKSKEGADDVVEVVYRPKGSTNTSIVEKMSREKFNKLSQDGDIDTVVGKSITEAPQRATNNPKINIDGEQIIERVLPDGTTVKTVRQRITEKIADIGGERLANINTIAGRWFTSTAALPTVIARAARQRSNGTKAAQMKIESSLDNLKSLQKKEKISESAVARFINNNDDTLIKSEKGEASETLNKLNEIKKDIFDNQEKINTFAGKKTDEELMREAKSLSAKSSQDEVEIFKNLREKENKIGVAFGEEGGYYFRTYEASYNPKYLKEIEKALSMKGIPKSEFIAKVQDFKQALREHPDFKKANEGKLDDTILNLVNRLSKDDTTLFDQPFKIIEDFLGSTTTTKGGTRVGRRKEIDTALLNLLGEVKDPYTKISNTLAKQNRIISELQYIDDVNKFFQNILTKNSDVNLNLGGLVNALPTTQARASRKELRGTTSQSLNKLYEDIFGVDQAKKLNTNVSNLPKEIYVDPNMDKLIRQGLDSVFPSSNKNSGGVGNAIWGGLQQAAAFGQSTQTILDYPAYFINSYGAVQNLIASGHLFNKEAWKSLRKSGKEMRKGIRNKDPKVLEYITKLKRDGVIDSDLTSEMIIRNLNQNSGTMAGGPFVQTYKKGMEKLSRAYGSPDTYAKIIAHKSETAALNKIFPKKSADEIFEMASDRVVNTMPTYGAANPAARFLGRIPFGTYALFPTEMLRTTKNIIKYAVKDIKEGVATGNKAQVTNGMRKVVGLGATGAGIGAAVDTNNTMYGITEDDKRALDAAAPDWGKGGNPLFLEGIVEDAQGKIITRNVRSANFDAQDYLKVPLRLMTGKILAGENVTDLEIEDAIKAMGSSILGPYTNTKFIYEALANVVTGVDLETDRPIYSTVSDEAGFSSENIKRAILELGSSLIPGSIEPLIKYSESSAAAEVTKDGKGLSKSGFPLRENDIITWATSGIRPSTIDVKKSIGYSLSKQIKDMAQSKKAFENFIRTMPVKDYSKPDNMQELLDVYKKYQDLKVSSSRRLADKINLFKNINYTDSSGERTKFGLEQVIMAATNDGFYENESGVEAIALADVELDNYRRGIVLPDDINDNDNFVKMLTDKGVPLSIFGKLAEINQTYYDKMDEGLVKKADGGSIMDSLLDMLNPISKANVGEEEALKNYLGQPQPVEIAPVLPNVISEGEENEEDIPPMPDWLANIMKDISKKPEEDRDRTAPLPPEKPNETKRKAKYGWKDNEVIQEIIKDEPIIERIIQAESSGNAATPDSSEGARGLMQIMKKTAEEKTGYGVNYNLSYNELSDPVKNVKYGADYFKGLKKYFGNDRDALIAYNWGPDNAKDWLEKGGKLRKLPKETRDYVKKILGSGK
jgi:hypothetical protein